LKEKNKPDIPFIAGLTVLIMVMCLTAGFFWQTVARQAEEEREAEKMRREQELQEAVSAIAVEYGNPLKKQVCVNLDTEEVFKCAVPEEGIYNRNGALIPGDVLEYGDMIRICGGTWKDAGEDGLPVLENPDRMERTSRADLHFAQTYQDIADELESTVRENDSKGTDTGDTE